MNDTDIRVRIAPSPSGNLHIGTARTALFNYLFAKKTGGKFILRIEDTDLERSNPEFTQNIFDSLKALELEWDEGPDVGGDFGPYQQSQRFDIYPKYAKKLLETGYAYECFCSPEELEAEKELSMKNKVANIYSNKCKNLTAEQKASLKQQGVVPAIRFKTDSKELKFVDMVKGELKFDTGLIGDFVIMKSNNTPTYNFAVVVDDMEMKISHIIRGEDHISNTPKQILLYEAFCAKIPQFAHLGMILAPDRSKLSKRHGATAVSDFILKGYLTEALVNFIALLGWAPSDGKEIKSIYEIIADFRLEDVSSSNSVFEYDKLNWLNGQYIKKMPIEELAQRIRPFLSCYNLSELSEQDYLKMIEITKEPLTVLSDIVDDVKYFFCDDVEIDSEVRTSVLDLDSSQEVLKEALNRIGDWDFVDSQKMHDQLGELREFFKEKGIKPKDTMWALRAALTGRIKGADISSVTEILGKDKVKNRIEKAIK